MTPEEASRRPFPGIHSIGEITVHIIAWQTVVRRRLQGERRPSIPDVHNWPRGPRARKAWESAQANLRTGLEQLISVLRETDSARLSISVPGLDYTCGFMLDGLVQHDLYHTGQIAILKKATRRGRNFPPERRPS